MTSFLLGILVVPSIYAPVFLIAHLWMLKADKRRQRSKREFEDLVKRIEDQNVQ